MTIKKMNQSLTKNLNLILVKAGYETKYPVNIKNQLKLKKLLKMLKNHYIILHIPKKSSIRLNKKVKFKINKKFLI